MTASRTTSTVAPGLMAPGATALPTQPNRHPVLALLAATAISSVGNQVTALAVPWFVLQTTGSAAKTGVTAAVTLAPTILALFLGGPLVDRTGFRRMSVLSDLLSGFTVALVPLFALTTGLIPNPVDW